MSTKNDLACFPVNLSKNQVEMAHYVVAALVDAEER